MTSKAATTSMLMSCVLLLAACGVPIPSDSAPVPAEPPRAGNGADVDTLVPLDEGSAALTGQLQLIAARATEVRDVMERVLAATGDATGDDPGDVAAVRALGEAAVGLLLGAPEGGTGSGLLPAVEPDRAGAGTNDLITGLITSAGDVGGERSRLVLELIRDPLVGDLGAWQRDPVGVITLLRSIADVHAAAGSDPAALDAALFEIPGDLTRALGYALIIAGSDDTAIAAHAAGRSADHLGVAIIATELAIERIGGS